MTELCIDKASDTLLFFTPEAGVVPHYVAQCLLAKTYQERGYKVAMAVCNGLLPRCPVMDMHSASFSESPEAQAQAHQHCTQCLQHALAITNHYGIPGIDLSRFVSNELRYTFQSVAQNPSVHPRDIQFDGIEFGKLSARDVVFATKTSNFSDLSPEVLQVWRKYASTALVTYLLTAAYMKSVKVGRLFFFNEYSSSLGAVWAAYKSGIPVRSITMAPHKGVDRQRIVYMEQPFPQIHRGMIDRWSEWRDVPLSKEHIGLITDDLMERTLGKSYHVYSPGKSNDLTTLLGTLGLDANKRTLVAYTSSMDELSAYQFTMEGLGTKYVPSPQPFAHQSEWLKYLIDFVRRDPSLQLVIRVHPREGKNKREGRESQHLQVLRNNLSGQFERCRIVWPEENISSYDLGEIAEIVLTSWSTLGLELSRLGAPVLTSFQNISFPNDDFMRFGGETVSEYGRSLEAMLRDPSASLDRIARAYRCYFLFNLSASLFLPETFPRAQDPAVPAFQMPAKFDVLDQLLHGATTVVQWNREEMFRAPRADFTQCYKREALRYAFVVMGLGVIPPDAEIVVRAAKKESFAADPRIPHSVVDVQVDSHDLAIAFQGTLHTRRSRLLARLLSVFADSAEDGAREVAERQLHSGLA